jgi:hypothetical protein
MGQIGTVETSLPGKKLRLSMRLPVVRPVIRIGWIGRGMGLLVKV